MRYHRNHRFLSMQKTVGTICCIKYSIQFYTNVNICTKAEKIFRKMYLNSWFKFIYGSFEQKYIFAFLLSMLSVIRITYKFYFIRIYKFAFWIYNIKRCCFKIFAKSSLMIWAREQTKKNRIRTLFGRNFFESVLQNVYTIHNQNNKHFLCLENI